MALVLKHGLIRIAHRTAARSFRAEHNLDIFVIVNIRPKSIEPAAIRTFFLFKAIRLVRIHIKPQTSRTVSRTFRRILYHGEHIRLPVFVYIINHQPRERPVAVLKNPIRRKPLEQLLSLFRFDFLLFRFFQELLFVLLHLPLRGKFRFRRVRLFRIRHWGFCIRLLTFRRPFFVRRFFFTTLFTRRTAARFARHLTARAAPFFRRKVRHPRLFHLSVLPGCTGDTRHHTQQQYQYPSGLSHPFSHDVTHAFPLYAYSSKIDITGNTHHSCIKIAS